MTLPISHRKDGASRVGESMTKIDRDLANKSNSKEGKALIGAFDRVPVFHMP